MDKEDLIKKLENTELPELEIKSHKAWLRMALLSSDYFKKLSFFDVIRKSLVFAIPAFAVLIIAGFIVIQPKLTEAKALSIAKSDPEIKKLMEEKNMVLGEVKVKDDKAYVLLNSLAETVPLAEKNPVIKIQKTEKGATEDIEGAIIELNLRERKVVKINSINSDEISPLAEEEKELAKEIANSEEVVGQIVPKEAIIEKIQSSLPKKIRLIEKNDVIEATSSEKNGEQKARVQYILNGKKWVVRVNLNERKVEEIEYSSDNNKGRD